MFKWLRLNLIRYKQAVIFLATCFSQAALGQEVTDQFNRRIQAHLIIKDFQSAKAEAQEVLCQYPHVAALHENYIRSLAYLGQEKDMILAWQAYVQAFPEKSQNRELIEDMCWGIVLKASHSASIPIRLFSLLAAYFSKDTKGIHILCQSLRDPNSAIRAVAVELSSNLRDAKLIAEIQRLFKEERVWEVRQQVIKAIGKMKIKTLSSDLKALIASEKSLAEEKALAIEALIHIWDEANREEIVKLTASNRAGLRLLASRAIGHFCSLRNIDQLFILATDHHAQVRLSAFQALGLIRPVENQEAILHLSRRGLQDPDFKAAISAAWLLTLYNPKEGQQALEKYLLHDRRDIRLLASAALNATGKYGAPLIGRCFTTHADAYVKLNLAIGAISQRLAVDQAAGVIDSILSSEKEKWSQREEGIFHYIAPRSLNKMNASQTPEMENQMVRLELLNVLAMIKFPKAQDAIRRFLLERRWGISGVASALLLMEGDDSAIDLVKALLQDNNQRVRIQAALILSLWGQEEDAIQVLEQSYSHADKEMKARILEGIGRVGAAQSIPFLINILKESSQHLRLMAATVLIECLNH